MNSCKEQGFKILSVAHYVPKQIRQKRNNLPIHSYEISLSNKGTF